MDVQVFWENKKNLFYFLNTVALKKTPLYNRKEKITFSGGRRLYLFKKKKVFRDGVETAAMIATVGPNDGIYRGCFADCRYKFPL